jgi:hypothetical protein
MKSEGSLQCSQKPSTRPYLKPDQSIPLQHISLRSFLTLSTHLLLGPAGGLFHSGFPNSILYVFFSPVLSGASSGCVGITDRKESDKHVDGVVSNGVIVTDSWKRVS